MRRCTLAVVWSVTAAAAAWALAESYRALLLWARGHGVPGAYAWGWPITVDSFVIIGESALVLALVADWSGWARVWPWMVTLCGLSVSVAANVGHIGAAPWTFRATAAVPPLAAFVALTVGLGVLKRVIKDAAVVDEGTAEEAVSPGAREMVYRLVDRGLTDTAELAAIVGVAERTARRYRADAEAMLRPSPARRRPPAASPPKTSSRHAQGAPRVRPLVAADVE